MSTFLETNKTTNAALSQSHTVDKSTYTTYVFIIIVLSFLLRLCCVNSYDLLVEEAYYWNYSQHLDFGYLDHPPMVALLIKMTTSIFGTHEFGVRISSMFCWLLTAFFSFKLTQLITRGAGQYAVMLLAILPFFFLQSLVITPDQPLIVCWSAALYCLYRSLVLSEPQYWYGAGLWIGLGLLSKYTIVLLGPAALIYVCIVPTARPWLTRKEPYLAALIATILFTPVIYWNATHEWISFAFQSTRRLHDTSAFSFHHFVGLLLLFLLPSGLLGLWMLLRVKENTLKSTGLSLQPIRFFQIFTLIPLIVFGVFSLNHHIKFNWIGPSLLALIPWLAILIKQSIQSSNPHIFKGWLISAIVLFLCYSVMIFTMMTGTPERAYTLFFNKFIDWSDLTKQVVTIANNVEAQTNTVPIIIPLDTYNISSELNFYQEKFIEHGDIQKSYAIEGRHYFGGNSLMYQYWSNKKNLAGNTLILISRDSIDFESLSLKNKIIAKSPIRQFWSHNQGLGANSIPYYYQVAEMRG